MEFIRIGKLSTQPIFSPHLSEKRRPTPREGFAGTSKESPEDAELLFCGSTAIEKERISALRSWITLSAICFLAPKCIVPAFHVPNSFQFISHPNLIYTYLTPKIYSF